MIANKLEINCSKNCELLLSLCYLLSPSKLESVASSLSKDPDSSAGFLARAINNLPQEKAYQLSEETLGSIGIFPAEPKSENNFLKELANAVAKIIK
jgi:hypothetical protein